MYHQAKYLKSLIIQAKTELGGVSSQLGFNETVPIYLASDAATLHPHVNKEGTTEVTARLSKEVKVLACNEQQREDDVLMNIDDVEENDGRDSKEGKELEIDEQQREDDVRAVIDDLLDDVDSTLGTYKKSAHIGYK